MASITLEQDQKHTTCVMLLLHTLEHVSTNLRMQEREVRHTVAPDAKALATHADTINRIFCKAWEILTVKTSHFWDDKLVTPEIKAVFDWLDDLLSIKKGRSNDIVGFLKANSDRIGKKFKRAVNKLSAASSSEINAAQKVIHAAANKIAAIRVQAKRHTKTIKQILRRILQGKPRIFIGSATESLNVASAIKNALGNAYTVTLWNKDNFFAAQVAIESLESAILRYDFAVFICTGDDQCVSSRSNQPEPIPRDNVIFEAGLFMGRLSHSRVFILREKGVRLPSDLGSINYIPFVRGTQVKKPVLKITEVCKRITDAIKVVIASQCNT